MLLASSLPTDRAGREEWLADREEAAARMVRAALRRIVGDAYEAWTNSLTADAGDLGALDSIPQAWMTFVDEEMVDNLGETYMAGQMTAWVGLPSSPGIDFAEKWSAVANENAISYMGQVKNRLKGVGDQTWTLVRRRATRGVELGWTNEQLKDSIQQLTQFSEYRADTIARTETVGAYVQGDMAGAQALGDKGPVEKVWVATVDARTRESHQAAHNQVVAFAGAFDVGGVQMSAPHAPGAPAGEVVNCRCYVEFLYAGDARPDGSKVTLAPASTPGPIASPRDRMAKGSSQAADGIDETRGRLTTAQAKYLRGEHLPGDPIQASKEKVQRNLRKRMGDSLTVGDVGPDLNDDNVFGFATSADGKQTGSLINLTKSRVVPGVEMPPISEWGGGQRGAFTDSWGGKWTAFKGSDPRMVDMAKDARVRELVAQWAGTSNDTSTVSLAIQETVKREFGLADTLDWTMKPDTAKAVAEELAKHGDEYRAFVRAQYDITQQWLKDEGITELRVFRGMRFQETPEWISPNALSGTTKYGKVNGVVSDVPLRPISSFSYDPSVADEFAGGSQWVVLDGYVPADRIFSTAQSGVGCLEEGEIVVLSGDGTWFAVGKVKT
jgi:hypothetical protein